MKTKKFLIIDANSLIHRAYHALPPLTTKDGILVNAVYGFANIFLKVLREHNPDYLAVCFDKRGKTFRDDIYDEYKAGRVEQPQEFYDQFDLIREFLHAFNVAVFEQDGYEADDLIGTLSNRQNNKLQITNYKIRKIILSGDKDMLQLVDDDTEVELVKKGVSDTVTYNAHLVKDELGFGPELVVDYKGLRGDTSDNIPGVPGVGEKTATDLITTYGNLEDIYDAIKKKPDEIKPGVLKKLSEYKKDAFMSRELATIVRDVKLRYNEDDLAVDAPDYDRVVALVQRLGFKSLLSRIPKPETGSLFANEQNNELRITNYEKDKKNESSNKEKKSDYILVDTKEKFEQFFKELKQQKVFAIDTETTSLNVIDAELLGISFSWKAGRGHYVPISNFQFPISKELKSILADAKIKKVGHNIKYDYEVFKQHGIELAGISFDSMIAAYLLNPGSRGYSLDALAFSEFGHQMIPITDLIGPKGKKQLSMRDVPVEQVAEYAAEDADFTWRLYEKLSKEKNLKVLKKVFEDIEIPLIPVLADMELRGVQIDVSFLKKMSTQLRSRIAKLESRIYKLAGREFNVASPIQLKEVLFDEMGISTDGLKRTKTGVSTAVSELEKLQGRHEIIDLIMEFRELSKLKNTYTDALPKLVDTTTGRVHTSFNQTIAATGRLSSTDPNLQNIPIRTELGAKVREAFIAARGYRIVAADYSQIELRIVASLSQDKVLFETFKNGEDIHRATAARIFDVDVKEVTSQQRRDAKVVNFGILYGLGAQGLSRSTNMNVKEARAFLDKYFSIHAGVKKFIEQTKDFARTHGYTETLLGRRRYFPEIQAEHPALQAQAERAAINLPMQGLNADIIKLAMIALDAEIKKRKWEEDVRMLMQVHDELVFEIKASLAEKASKVIKDIMEHVYTLKVPIVVDVGIGKSWGEAK